MLCASSQSSISFPIITLDVFSPPAPITLLDSQGHQVVAHIDDNWMMEKYKVTKFALSVRYVTFHPSFTFVKRIVYS